MALGYEFMSHRGLFLRSTGGVTFRTDDATLVSDEDRIGPTFHFGAGYKFR